MKKVISILLVAVIALSFTACTINVTVNDSPAATPAETAAKTTAATTTAAPATTAAANTDTTQASADTTAAPADTTANSSTGEKTTEEIVELYNTAVNKVKSESSTITRNYKHLQIPEDSLELPSGIESIAKTAISTFVKDNDEAAVMTTDEEKQSYFPVGGTDYSSTMTADMVETATCTDNGDSYSVEIKLYDDSITSPEKGQGYAGVFNTTTASSIDSVSIPTVTFNKVNVNGINGSISCTIDKANSRVTEITFASTDVLEIEAKVVVSTVNAKMNLVQEENFTVEY